MSVLQTTIRDCRLKSLDVTYSQRSQQREMNEYFITSGCRTGASKRTPVRSLGRDHRRDWVDDLSPRRLKFPRFGFNCLASTSRRRSSPAYGLITSEIRSPFSCRQLSASNDQSTLKSRSEPELRQSQYGKRDSLDHQQLHGHN